MLFNQGNRILKYGNTSACDTVRRIKQALVFLKKLSFKNASLYRAKNLDAYALRFQLSQGDLEASAMFCLIFMACVMIVNSLRTLFRPEN